jgi:elongation factor 1-gamma
VDNKKPEFLRKFPLGQIPAFEGKDGFLLTQTPAIMKYSACRLHAGDCMPAHAPAVASHSPKASELLGKTAQEQALVDQWLSFAMSELQESISRIFRMLYGLLPYSEPVRSRPACTPSRRAHPLPRSTRGTLLA